MCDRVFAIIFQLFKLIMLEKCVLTILELNWNQRLGHKKTKLNICHHMLTSSTQLQNRSFYVVERTRTSAKCQKMKYARGKRAKILFFIVKDANLSGFCCRRRRGCLSSLLTRWGEKHSKLFIFIEAIPKILSKESKPIRQSTKARQLRSTFRQLSIETHLKGSCRI